MFVLSRWKLKAQSVLQRIDRNRSEGMRRRRFEELVWRARGGAPLSRLMIDVYALVGEAATNALGKTPYPVQIMAAMGLFEGRIVEMQTGEGKTLTMTMPVVLRAMMGRGCHVVTSNDYLASRDAEEMGHVYSQLGLTCGCVLQSHDDDQRREAYACDITYGTAAQFGFDFLRDRLKRGTHSPYDDDRILPGRKRGPTEVQRGHYCALVDEADSVLIDDAVTPLLIGLAQENPLSTFGLLHWSEKVAGELRLGQDFLYEREKRRAVLTEGGCRRILLTGKPAVLDQFHIQKIYEYVETALSAKVGLRRDTDYVVSDGEVVIVDESTGRKMPGRKWQNGLHQAVETKEKLEITDETVHAAQITVQSYFRQYEFLAGMTGTAVQARSEFRRVYRRKVTPVPPHRKCRRVGMPPRVFRTLQAKRQAIADTIVQMHHQGRSILIGTPSVFESEALSELLNERRIVHQVLNARQDEREAFIISQAGQSGQVTIATNMAGRGTDILIDSDVRKAGGLHVIASAMHSAARIDRQLIGRSGRQGDPGSYQFFLSLEDPLLEMLPKRMQRRCERLARKSGAAELNRSWWAIFRRAQKRSERLHVKQRRQLFKVEAQRTETSQKMGLDPYVECTGDS